MELIDSIINNNVKKRLDDLKQVGVFLEPDVFAVYEALGNKGGRGARSEMVNLALRKMYKEKGLL